MKLKLILIFITLAVYSEAFKSTLRKTLNKNFNLEQDTNNQPNIVTATFNNDVNLIIDAYVNDLKTPFPIALDTRSSDFWFVSTKCSSAFCETKEKSGIVNGKTPGKARGEAVLGTETTMKINFDKDQEDMNVDVIAAEYVNPLYAKSLDSSTYGVLGLGPLTHLKKSLKPSLLISLSIDDNNSPAIYFNELPPNYNVDDYPSLTYAKSIRQDEWRIKLDYISTFYNFENEWCKYGCQAVIDLNFRGIAGPTKDINSLNKYLGAEEDGTIDCYKKYQLDPLIFHIASRRILLNPKNFIVKGDDLYSSKCKTVFVPINTYNSLWVLGMPFHQDKVTVFDYAENKLAFLPMNSVK